MFLGDEYDASAMCSLSPSPIRVDCLNPLATGDRTFELEFFHANYPEGVQSKTLQLQTIHRGESGILARSKDHSPPRFLYMTDLTSAWLEHNFPQFAFDSESLQSSLNRALGETSQ